MKHMASKCTHWPCPWHGELIHNLCTSFKLVSNCSVVHCESRTVILKYSFHALTHLRMQNVLFETQPWSVPILSTLTKRTNVDCIQTMFYCFINYTGMYCTHELCFKIRSYVVSHVVNWLLSSTAYPQLNLKPRNKKNC